MRFYLQKQYTGRALGCGLASPILVVLALALSFGFVGAAFAQSEDSLEKYYTANALYNRGLYDVAIKNFNRFLEENPQHEKAGEARYGLALAYYKTARITEARRQLERIAGNPDVPQQMQIHNLLGQCYLKEGMPGEAENAFRRNVNRGKERFFVELPGFSQEVRAAPEMSVSTVMNETPFARSMAGLVESLYQQGEWQAVIRTADEMLEVVPEGRYTGRVRYLEALSHYNVDQYESAAGVLRRLLAKKEPPHVAHVYFLLGESYRKMEQIEQAVKHYRVLVDKYESEYADRALFRGGVLLFQEKKYEEAEKWFARLRNQFPESAKAPRAQLYMGRCNFEQKQYKRAGEILRKARKNEQIRAEVLLWLGRNLLAREEGQEATQLLAGAVSEFDEHELARYLLVAYGNALMAVENYEKAAQIFEKVGRRFSDEPIATEARRLQAEALHESDEYENSLRECNVYLKNHSSSSPERAKVRFLKAENLFFLERWSKAESQYRDFIANTDQRYTPRARVRLAQINVKQEVWPKVLQNLGPLVDEVPEGEFFSEVRYLAGLAAYYTQKWRKSVELLQTFVENHPENPHKGYALLRASLSYANLGKRNEAIGQLRRLLRDELQEDIKTRAMFELGKLYYRDEKFTESAEVLEQLVEDYPESSHIVQAHYFLGWDFLELDKSEKAVKHFRAVEGEDVSVSLRRDALFQRCLVHVRENRHTKAQKLLEGFLKQYPDSNKASEASFYYGVVRLRRDQEDAEALLKFLDEYPESDYSARAHYEVAWNARRRGNVKKARKHYEILTEEYSEADLFEKSLLELADLEYEQENYDTALGYLDRLQARSPPAELKEKMLYRRGWCFLGRQQKDQAVSLFERFLNRYPESEYVPVVAYQVGEIYFERQQYEKARSRFATTVNFEAHEPEKEIRAKGLIKLGQAYAMLGEWQEARQRFSEYLDNYQDQKHIERARFWLGRSYQQLESFEKALSEFRTVLKKSPGNELAVRAQFQIGECWFSLGEYDEAVSSFVQLLTQYDSPEWRSKAMLEMGIALDNQGKREQSNQQLKELIETYPNRTEATAAENLLDERGVSVD